MTIKKIKKNSGFVILFAVTLSAIVLAIALGVASVALKEVKFGTSARATNDAFFAADTGIEYVLFKDKDPTFYPMPAVGLQQTFNPPTTLTGLGSSGASCAIVTITKDDTTPPGTTTIISKGYNIGDVACSSTNPNRIEREIDVSY